MRSIVALKERTTKEAAGMDNRLEKKYGLPTAVCMVVGIVIGSGVFFKAETVLNKTGGNMPLGILAWGIVGAIMIICSYVFATMATRYEKVNGLVDYAEATWVAAMPITWAGLWRCCIRPAWCRCWPGSAPGTSAC